MILITISKQWIVYRVNIPRDDLEAKAANAISFSRTPGNLNPKSHNEEERAELLRCCASTPDDQMYELGLEPAEFNGPCLDEMGQDQPSPLLQISPKQPVSPD